MEIMEGYSVYAFLDLALSNQYFILDLSCFKLIVVKFCQILLHILHFFSLSYKPVLLITDHINLDLNFELMMCQCDNF